MKIALVCDWYLPRVGGIERQLTQLARHLATAGHDVTVITPTRGTAGDADETGVRLQRLDVPLLPGIGLIWTPRGFRALAAALRAGNFDVVHAHSSIVSPAAYAAVSLGAKLGLPTAVTVHSIWGRYRHAFHALDRFERWSRWPVAFSAVSERAAREIRPFVSPRPIDIVPNAIVPAEWQVARQPPAAFVAIACVMRLAPRKRGAVLLRALRAALDHLPTDVRVRLEIAGDGAERRRLARLARQLGLGESVQFLGILDVRGVKALLARSHFFVLPTAAESFGIAALEARTAGLPVVAMRASGVTEFIAHGREGVLANDDRELAQHLARLCTDAAEREAIAHHNESTPVTLTWDRSLAAHLALYARARELARH
ncbi:MAG TPA: glycosyltransferase family 4 protein [Opitutaceae bacterium]|nr:glycosyltransferase family 4 protein [Opitutaceae bacterium]